MKRILLALAAVLMALPVSLSAKDKTADIKVISYNIRVGTAKDGTNSWEYRYPASAMMIEDQKPDIFGLQEALDFQVKYLEAGPTCTFMTATATSRGPLQTELSTWKTCWESTRRRDMCS